MSGPVRPHDALHGLLWASETLFAAELDADGTIVAANDALAGAAARSLGGEPFASLMAGPQGGAFRTAFERATADWSTVTVGFLQPGGGAAEDRRLHLRREEAGVLAVAEPASGERDRLVEQVLALNDDLIASQRALGRRQRELEDAREESEQALARVRALEDITLAGVSNADLDDVLRTLLRTARDVLVSDQAAVLLLDDETGTLVMRAAVGFGKQPGVGHGVGMDAALLGVGGQVVVDALDAAQAERAPVGVEGGSLAAVALLLEGRPLGALYVSAAAPSRFSPDAVRLLQIIGERAALAIGQAQLRDRERRISQTLQRTLLPSRLAAVPGVRLAARYVPRAYDVNVGGDFYDAFAVGDGAVGLLIGDVAGKGLPAAAAMGHLRSAARAWALDDPPPGEMLDRLDHLAADDEAVLATALYARVDARTGELQHAAAGHPPPVLIEGDRSSFLEEARSPPLGMALRDRPSASVRLAPGARLLLYTDGLVERRRTPLDETLEQLRALGIGAPADLEELCRYVLDAFGHAAGFADDVALLAVGFSP